MKTELVRLQAARRPFLTGYATDLLWYSIADSPPGSFSSPALSTWKGDAHDSNLRSGERSQGLFR